MYVTDVRDDRSSDFGPGIHAVRRSGPDPVVSTHAMSDSVCLISGVGPGTGASLARRFAAGGYRVAMLARNGERLKALESEIEGSRAYVCDVSDREAVRTTAVRVGGDLGAPSVLVHNAVEGVFGDFLEVDPDSLRANFEVNVMGLLHLARAVVPAMIEAGRGAVMVTGNTAARRGMPRFAGFAPTKAGQRILAESMARTLGPQGIHVAYFVIDAVIDSEWTRRRMPEQPDDFFIKPDAIAENVWHVAHQDPSAWSFDVEMRPYRESW